MSAIKALGWMDGHPNKNKRMKTNDNNPVKGIVLGYPHRLFVSACHAGRCLWDDLIGSRKTAGRERGSVGTGVGISDLVSDGYSHDGGQVASIAASQYNAATDLIASSALGCEDLEVDG